MSLKKVLEITAFAFVLYPALTAAQDGNAAPAAENGKVESGFRIDAKSLKDATHIEFVGHDDWRYDVRRSSDKTHITIQFTGLSPDQFTELKALKDDRVARVDVRPGLNNDAQLEFALTSGGINLFDYQTDSPTRLVFDLFKENAKPAVEKPSGFASKHVSSKGLKGHAKAHDDFVAASTLKAGKLPKVTKRAVASVDHPEIGSQPLLNSTPKEADSRLQIKDGVFDGGDQDMNRFKFTEKEIDPNSVIKSTREFYIHFPALEIEKPYLKNITSETMPHTVSAEGGDEPDQVRLMVQFYNEGKFALVFKTLSFFKEKFKQTQFQETIDFLLADTYYKMWLRDQHQSDFEEAINRYKQLLNKYPNDPNRFHILMSIGQSYLSAGNLFGALSTFQVGVGQYPESPFYWQMRMTVAEVLARLNKDKDALAEYEKIENDPRAGSFAMEARFRRGDIYFFKKDYAQAVKEYKAAREKYADHVSEGPNLFFNEAESLFWLKDYAASLSSYRDFLQHFPTHAYGGYAMTRIGELLDILGGDKKKSHGAFLESYFRYRGTPGAFVAKLHVNTDRFSQMKVKEVKAVRDEINDESPALRAILGEEDLDTFITLSLAHAYESRNENQPAFDMLVQYYKKNVMSPYLPLYRDYIVENLTKQLTDLNRQGKPMKTVELYLKNLDSWFNSAIANQRLDTLYTVGQAYEALDVPADATSFYANCLKQVKALTPTQLQTAQVFQELPSVEELNLRLAATSLRADKVKAAANYLGEIKNTASFTEAEKVEKALLLSTVAEKEERSDLALLALSDLNEHWQGRPDLLADAWIKIARILSEQKKAKDALPWVDKVIQAANAPESKVKDETERSAWELAGDIHANLNQVAPAVEAYKAYLAKVTSGPTVAAVRYKLGKLYFDHQDTRNANETWAALKDDENGSLWAKMAAENLTQAKWNAKYDRYLDKAGPRSPASQPSTEGNTKKP